jgi:hypothetical protein
MLPELGKTAFDYFGYLPDNLYPTLGGCDFLGVFLSILTLKKQQIFFKILIMNALRFELFCLSLGRKKAPTAMTQGLY